MKQIIYGSIGAVGSAIAWLFGGWSASIITLLIFMLCDYITGLMVAGIFHKSKKTESGNLSSRAGWKGLCKKFTTLIFVVVAYRLDLLMGSNFIRDGVCIAFITNEALSIVENAGLMGIPIPEFITKALAILNKESTEKDEQS